MTISLHLVDCNSKPDAECLITDILEKTNIVKETDVNYVKYVSDDKDTNSIKEVLIKFNPDTNLDELMQVIEDEYFEKLFLNTSRSRQCSIESDISILENVNNIENEKSPEKLSSSYESSTKNEMDSDQSNENLIKVEKKDEEEKEDLRKHLVKKTDLKASETQEYLTMPSERNSSENLVEFCFKKPLVEKEKDAIMMFLENAKGSGGGDILEYKQDSKEMCLSVNYSKPLYKKRVLENRSFKFLGYEFMAVEPLDKSKFPEDRTLMILKDFSADEPILHIQMFSENLVDEDNEVEWIVPSKFFPSTYYVRFKDHIELNNVKLRLKRRPSLHGNKINIIPAFETNLCILMIPNNKDKISREIIELHFENKKRCGASGFVQIYEKDSYMVLRFDSKENALKVASLTHNVSNQELIIEYLHSYDILSQNMISQNTNELVDEQKMPDMKVSKVKKQSETMPLPLKCTVPIQEKTSEKNKKVERQCPSYKLDLATEPKLRLLTIDFIHGAFTKELFKSESMVCKREDNIVPINFMNFEKTKKLNDKEYNDLVERWEKRIKAITEKFLMQFKTELIKSTKESVEAINFDKTKIKIDTKNNEDFEICGFSDSVDNFISQIESLNERKPRVLEIGDLKLHECRILFTNKYIKKMSDKFPNLNVNIKSKLGYLKLEGMSKEVAIAQKEALSMINSIISETMAINEIETKFFSEKEVCVCKWLKEKNIEIVLEVRTPENSLIIYSTNEKEIQNFKEQIFQELETREFDLNIIDNKTEFKNRCSSMDNEMNLVYVIRNENLLLHGFNDNVVKYYEELSTL